MTDKMMLLHIDDKWSIEFDPTFNDSPKNVVRYGEVMDHYPPMDNLHIAMFYALLEYKGIV